MSIAKLFGHINRSIRRHKNSKMGYFLIEFIIAIAIFSLISMLIFQYQWNIKKLNIDAFRLLEKIDEVSEQIEGILAKRNMPNLLQIEKKGAVLTVNAKKVCLTQADLTSLGLEGCKQPENFYKVTVAAQWKDLSDTERILKISTGVVLEKNDKNKDFLL